MAKGKVKFEVPADAAGRMTLLMESLNVFNTEYADFKASGKKAAGNRAKKVLTSVRKLLTPVRRDIAIEVKNATKIDVVETKIDKIDVAEA